MSKLPTVAIIGRPNTGKSTLFNRLVGRRKAIVSDVPGTTRDHVANKVEHEELDYLLIDTGGMGGGTDDKELEDDVEEQSLLALEHADLILFTVNSREDLTSADFEIVDLLRKKRKRHVPVFLVLTKCDNPEETEELVPKFYELSITDKVIPVSAPHKIGMEELEKMIVEELKELNFKKVNEEDLDIPKIAILGKPNVGKSSIVNGFMNETQREKSPLLVSDIAGTTRDTTDTVIRYHDKDYMFIDTAGIKRRASTESGIETHAYFRSVHALEECDIAVLVLDTTEEVTKQDKRIAGMAMEEGKGLIILLNKIDLLDTDKKAFAMAQAEEALSFCKFAPKIACSAETREGLLKIFDQIEMVQRNRTRRIQTKDLKRWFEDSVYGQPMGSLAKSKYITQAEQLPPTFVIFVKEPKKVQVSQLKFLDNRLRKTFGFEGTPIRWITKSSNEAKAV